jgi:hypothetical protein
MSDPRNPKRPDGEAGSNWVRCRDCGREARKIVAIRHRKSCRARRPR